MRRALTLGTLALVWTLGTATSARADDWATERGGSSSLATWGVARTTEGVASTSRDAPVTRARELLTRSRILDDAAEIDEKAAAELSAKLPALRVSAKTARERAQRATTDKEAMVARADDLDVDLVVSEAEIVFKHRTAVENRRMAHELRQRAVTLVREAPSGDERTASACDPPFRFTADGRKSYRMECLK